MYTDILKISRDTPILNFKIKKLQYVHFWTMKAKFFLERLMDFFLNMTLYYKAFLSNY